MDTQNGARFTNLLVALKRCNRGIDRRRKLQTNSEPGEPVFCSFALDLFTTTSLKDDSMYFAGPGSPPIGAEEFHPCMSAEERR